MRLLRHIRRNNADMARFENHLYMKILTLTCMLLSMLLQPLRIAAQEAPQVLINPEVSYAGVIKNYTIANLSVNGVDGYEDYMLTSISGLSVGQEISVPGSEITDAVKRYWKHWLF